MKLPLVTLALILLPCSFGGPLADKMLHNDESAKKSRENLRTDLDELNKRIRRSADYKPIQLRPSANVYYSKETSAETHEYDRPRVADEGDCCSYDEVAYKRAIFPEPPHINDFVEPVEAHEAQPILSQPPTINKPAEPIESICDDETWIGSEGLCFKAILFSNTPTSFVDGKSICESTSGAYAAPFRGKNDRLAIQLAIEKTNHAKGADFYSGYYIGIRNHAATRADADDFRFEHDSSSISFSTFTANQPDKLDRGELGWEQCVTVLDNDNLNWNDVPCNGFHDLIYGIICAKQAEANDDHNIASSAEMEPPATDDERKLLRL